tara:strand:- start:1414 stop:2463 length:1050 start_codon:yes stop_codon:yes gene_type:complete
MFNNKIIRIVSINLIFLLTIIVFFEIFFGSWFTNNFKYKLSSERNINRIYKLDFEYHKGTAHYVKNDYGFRIKSFKKDYDPSSIDIVFLGGSTVNQKFLEFEDTIVGIISEKNKSLKIANSGIDGMSIKGHINSFQFWFDKINNFNPKYFIYIIGINDRYMVETFSFRDHVDNLEESNFTANLREYFESNSFFYKNARKLKSLLYLKYGLDIGVKKVKRNHVYIERDRVEFITYNEREKIFDKLNNNKKKKYLKFEKWYLNKLNELTNLVIEKGAIPIFINQTTGYGHSYESFVVAKTITNHCKKNKLTCLNLAKEINLEYEDFYDESHVNRSGSKKMAEFIYSNLPIF